MAATVKRFLGYGQERQDASTTKRGLPASWYRSPEMYELERRAIFSKKWILVTHRSRFENPGDYLRITEAGFSFFLSLGKDDVLRGFHNICRHRGFPLLHNDEGNAKILACKYHGWSYGINGKLAKAPHFEDFSDFDKDKTSLLPIHVHIDQLEFVWVNLEATEVPTTSWDEQLDGVDRQKRFEGFNFSQYRFDHTWGMQGEYNWKVLADNYNECLHCRTAHPDTAGLVEIDAYRVEGKAGNLQHYNRRQEDGIIDFKLASTYYFPNACMTVTPDFFYMMRCVPISSTESSMEYEVYRKIDGDPVEFDKVDRLFKRVLAEDKWLCNETQKNLAAGVYVNGPLHPAYEFGPLYFQSIVKRAVLEHHKEEEKQKSLIWPASPTVGSSADEDEAFCAGLSCGSESNSLAW
ncbi:uncharacterized protein A1O9_02276 [Exophiala aquamarina CBS 119918]|uniref:Choline monooxygenase, chloroplastic n=1 Tax=Exophiala aquamarina CBS 119918 TaxID=1182545 RepID=A0A072PYN0_9EURO|nr:uncharacterized protein A1O9_02276 [Exophiala aquamarina CBS 119918]KEF60715.1 hypothetical protein A1O9_02276 [Exophiala aquamarina CBS 119918]